MNGQLTLTYNAVATLSMFFISLAVRLIDLPLHGKATRAFFSTERASLLNPLTYLRFVTHIFGHADWQHLRNNYMLILIVGPLVEDKYGVQRFCEMVLITAAATGIVNCIIGRYRVFGSSSVAFMLIMMSAFVNVKEKTVPITLILVALFYLTSELKDLTKKDGVSHISHLVGAVCGALFGFAVL